MRALALTTRFRDGAFEGDACLLVYDEVSISGAIIGEDVRDVLDRRPNTPHIYVFAPFHTEGAVLEAVQAGTGVRRANGDLAVLTLRRDGERMKLLALWQQVERDVPPPPAVDVPLEMQEGWLFDLFDRHRGLVDAPPGVHFGKASGKHADKFLRTSSVLLSTAACGLLGSMAFARRPTGEVRRIFVDTAPLLSVVFAMYRIATVHDLWQSLPPARSFSSYGGLEQLPSIGHGDLAIISASTSGGLAGRLIEEGFREDNVLTLYILKSTPTMSTNGAVLCDLTFRPGRTFGYPQITNQSHQQCSFCNRGWLLAELEGDQFLLEKRGVKRLRSNNESQTESSRKTFDLLARQDVLRARFYSQGNYRTDVAVDAEKILTRDSPITASFIRLMVRFTPVPVTYVILVDLSEACFQNLVEKAGLQALFANAHVVTGDQVGQLPIVEGGNVLVMVGCLSEHAKLRGINAQLRVRTPRGCVAYLSAVTIADSGRNLSDLKVFLSWGEHGPETFIYRAAVDLMLPWRGDQPSSWDRERELLLRLDANVQLDATLRDRLAVLNGASCEGDGLFLPGQNGSLRIAADFVYLNTQQDIESVSQADIYAVVSNLLANARCGNEGFKAANKEAPVIRWSQSVYGQVLVSPATLCPSNFRDYNDSILRAAFLRAAHPAELNYAVDEACSAEVLDILIAEVDAWRERKGDALPEFLMSLASGRLRLRPAHLEKFKAVLGASSVPPFLLQLANEIPQD